MIVLSDDERTVGSVVSALSPVSTTTASPDRAGRRTRGSQSADRQPAGYQAVKPCVNGGPVTPRRAWPGWATRPGWSPQIAAPRSRSPPKSKQSPAPLPTITVFRWLAGPSARSPGRPSRTRWWSRSLVTRSPGGWPWMRLALADPVLISVRDPHFGEWVGPCWTCTSACGMASWARTP